MPPATREQQQPYVLEGVTAQDDRARLLHVPSPVGVHVLDTARVSVSVGEEADGPAMGPQVEVAGGQGLRYRGKGGVPPLVVEGTEAGHPGGVGGRRKPVV